MTYSTSTNIEFKKPNYKHRRWDVELNEDIDVLDQLFSQELSIDVTAGDVTLTTSQANHIALAVTGSPSATRNVTLPRPGFWFITTHAIGQDTVVKGSAGDTGVTLKENLKWLVYSNGTNANLVGPPVDAAGKVLPAYDSFSTGTRMVFHQASAPAGWTRDTSLNDIMLRVVSGTVGSGGSWTISGFTIGNTTLSSSTVPARTVRDTGANATVAAGDSAPATVAAAVNTTYGGGGSHGHSISHSGSWRPPYVDVIVAQKD